MRKLLAMGLVVFVLTLGLAQGGSRFAAASAHTSGNIHQVADLSQPDGVICGGSASTPC